MPAIKLITNASSPAVANRPRSISTKSPAASIACTVPAGLGRLSCHLLLRILPPLVVADLGAGEGLLSELLARRCKKVIAVDNSEKIVEFATAKAKKNHLKNLEFRLGNLQNPPIEPGTIAVAILRPGPASRRRPCRQRRRRCLQDTEACGGQVLIPRCC